MPDTQPALPPGPLHRNQQLFSDYYLNEILPGRADWQRLTETAEPVRRQIAALLAAYHPSANEAQTEADLVRPVLKALGHDFEVQPALKTPDGTKKPDYVFYRDADSLLVHKNKTLTDSVAQSGAFAVGDAKYWDRPLDSALPAKGGDLFTNKNPGYQIAFYIQHSGVEWGILTNGRLWRLYHRDSAHKLDRFYEVDLKALSDADDPAPFLYFYAFFRRAAFDAQPLGVSAILAASEDYARGVGSTLKSQVYDALRHLAQGFLDYAPNALTLDDADTRRAIYDNSLILLYRLLFVLYAEARELLPVRESPIYRDSYSLHAIKQDVARDLKTGKALLPTSATLWPRLKELFRSIDQGNPPLKVATFNGGLFDPRRHPFLEHNTVGDARLQRALDMLARVDGQFVDYRDLAVRHLGTIYEGLLEYALQPVPQEGDWTVALVNDKGERKATGSYYTPDYIVKYIVEQTVGPMLAEAVAGGADDAAQLEAVLGVNVLDPAMGSGHFLVEATEYIARFLIDRALRPGADAGGEADLLYWKRRVAQSCIYGVDLNPLAVELAKLSLWLTTVAKDRPLSFLDHHLRTGNALVGARLADLQMGGKKPKAGKKAIQGKQWEAAGQITMMADNAFTQSMTLAVGNMWMIEERDAYTVADVKAQETLYVKLREDFTAKWGRPADVVASTHFDLSIQPTFWEPFLKWATGRALTGLPQFTQWLDKAKMFGEEYHFFHWELEFPEVYFDRFGRSLGDKAGFDAVIGNPPYVRQEELGVFKPAFQALYPEVYSGVADLSVYFFAQALRQLQEGGRTAYISSNSWLRANYAMALRSHLRQTATVEQIIDLGDNRVFADAPDVYPAVHVFRKAAPTADHTAQVATFTRGEGLKSFREQVSSKLSPVSMHDQTDSGWQLGDDAGRKIFAKLVGAGKPLGKVIEGQIYYGIKTGLNEVFIVDEATKVRLITEDASSEEIIKPVVQGEDLRPWYVEDERRWLIFTRRGIKIDSYPAVKKYLEQFRHRLEPRPTTLEPGQKWLGRKSGTYKWYEIQDSVDYYKAFDKPKICWPDIAKSPRFCWDTSGLYLGNTGYIATPDEPWILGYLASRCAWFLISKLSIPLGERAGVQRFRLIDQYMRPLPVPDVSASDREAIGSLVLAITEQARARYDLHQRVRRRIVADLGTPDGRLNNKLTAWWTLDLPTLRAELQKAFQRDIPLKDRDDWDDWLTTQKAKHQQHTAQIVAHETDLNARVYALFALTPDEIKGIEDATKYRYGEV